MVGRTGGEAGNIGELEGTGWQEIKRMMDDTYVEGEERVVTWD